MQIAIRALAVWGVIALVIAAAGVAGWICNGVAGSVWYKRIKGEG
jgi:hypothetical protein